MGVSGALFAYGISASRYKFQIMVFADLVGCHKRATGNSLKDHYATAVFLNEPICFRVTQCVRDKFDLGWIAMIEDAISLLYFLAGRVCERHLARM